jgi:hypothetical protein
MSCIHWGSLHEGQGVPPCLDVGQVDTFAHRSELLLHTMHVSFVIDYGINWDGGKEPPTPCQFDEHGTVDHCRCCQCQECVQAERYRFSEDI